MKIIHGIKGAPGIAVGKLFVYKNIPSSNSNISLEEAIKKADDEIAKSEEKAFKVYGDENAKIFSAYRMILNDESFLAPIRTLIAGGASPADAVKSAAESVSEILLGKKSEYMRQRADDIIYIGKLLTDIINGAPSAPSLPNDGKKYIIAAHELTPMDTMRFDSERLAGFITETGGSASHTVILAKSIGIPAVVGACNVTKLENFQNVYLDGESGILICTPDNAADKKYQELLKSQEEFRHKISVLKNSDACTKDGKRIAVCINIGNPLDLSAADCRYDGVGLFRSEFLYSSANEKPTFEAQYNAYKSVIDTVSPNPVTIRTLDIGGDKPIEYILSKHEANPFLGNRGIRLCLNNKELFAEQLAAILCAAAETEVRIMLPMITTVDEIKQTRQLIHRISKEITDKGKKICDKYLLGIMIETPTSAISADIFAKECDFFSIGTNDLIQYVAAADRGNPDVEKLYNPYHPSVIRILKHVIRTSDIDVSICGDLAADMDFTELLIGLGLRKFSVPIPMTEKLKYRISRIDTAEAEGFAEKVLALQDENEIKNMLKEHCI